MDAAGALVDRGAVAGAVVVAVGVGAAVVAVAGPVGGVAPGPAAVCCSSPNSRDTWQPRVVWKDSCLYMCLSGCKLGDQLGEQ